MPYSKPLEEIAFPHEPHIVRAVLSVLGVAEASSLPLPIVEGDVAVKDGQASLAAQQPHADAEIREAQL
jgi:hypothetical protein